MIILEVFWGYHHFRKPPIGGFKLENVCLVKLDHDRIISPMESRDENLETYLKPPPSRNAYFGGL